MTALWCSYKHERGLVAKGVCARTLGMELQPSRPDNHRSPEPNFIVLNKDCRVSILSVHAVFVIAHSLVLRRFVLGPTLEVHHFIEFPRRPREQDLRRHVRHPDAHSERHPARAPPDGQPAPTPSVWPLQLTHHSHGERFRYGVLTLSLLFKAFKV